MVARTSAPVVRTVQSCCNSAALPYMRCVQLSDDQSSFQAVRASSKGMSTRHARLGRHDSVTNGRVCRWLSKLSSSRVIAPHPRDVNIKKRLRICGQRGAG